ncbi:GIY-YIG nuclease family protein [Candidatus Omnitrophota bacterium]
MYNVYVLISLKDKRFYIGLTSNLDRRIKEHLDGKNPSTTSRRPLELIFHEVHYNKTDAARREQYFKTTKGKHTLRQMVKSRLKELGVEFVEI